MSDLLTPESEIINTPLGEALAERYLAYALSTIMHRALPDVRDGLKPVHRRLLYAMRQLRLDPASGFKKSARVVGDVIGKYHPHGDQSVYDALVRLAQDFSIRYPLIDGQGNFGNVDGDNAAAMRYTETRLTEVAQALLEGIDEDAVDFRDTYDGEESEPLVLPAAFPNLLANGANGIAVGMATSIPPHNVAELCDAMLHLIKFPNAGIEKLVDFVQGPDFPTGGVIIEPRASILDAYATGRGGFRVRARWEVEKTARSGYQIIVTEIPYQVQKGKLIEKVAELINNRKLGQLGDIRDESAEDIRIVLEPRARTVEPEILMQQLFQLTDFEVRIPLNLNVLDLNLTPRVMDLREALRAFLAHRKQVLVRRSQFRLARIVHRLEVLDGYIIAFLNLDKIIRIIRNEDEPKPKLIAAFKLTDIQAEAILDMRLRALRKLEEEALRREHKTLSDERKLLNALIKSDEKQWAQIAEDIKALRVKFGPKTPLGKRRTTISDAPVLDEIPFEAMIEREPVTIVCSQKGWIRQMKGHLPEDPDMKYKEGDGPAFWLQAQTTDRLILFATNGRFYTLRCDKLPGGRGHGEPVRLMIDLDNDHEIVTILVHDPARSLLVASSDGHGFIVAESEVVAATRNGKQVLNVSGDVEAMVCTPAVGDFVAVVGENRKLLLFPRNELPVMTRGKGVILQRYKDGGLSDAKVFTWKEGLTWQDRSGRRQSEQQIDEWKGSRAQAGRLPPRGFPRNNKFG
ncbi:MAG TPA: DNA topoisomerase IV subunit A [Alphaproteobacteria bacterium]|nr:DNA topoisomerase IV subunit A [Alphaproteobacteria bacterium]